MSVRRSSFSSKESMEDKIIKEYREAIGKDKKKKEKFIAPSPYLQNVAPLMYSHHRKQDRPFTAKPARRQHIVHTMEVSSPVEKTVEINEQGTYSVDNYSSSFTDSSSSSDSENEIKEMSQQDNSEDKNEIKKKSKIRPSSAQVKKVTSSSQYFDNVLPEQSSYKERPLSAKASQRRRYNSVDAVPVDNTSEADKKSDFNDNYSSSFTDSSDEMEKNMEILISSNSQTEVNKENKVKRLKKRPLSAQIKRSDFFTKEDISKSIFERQTHVITCTAYRNGSFDGSVRIASATIKQLLEDATLRLGLNMAARRVFLFDGTEVFRPQDVPKDADVYISRGEAFRNPYKVLKNSRNIQSATAWSAQGVSLPPRRKKKPPSSKRLNELVGKNTTRIIVYKNGEGGKSYEVVFNEQDPPQRFLDDCTQRLGFNASAKVLYNWKGKEVVHIKEVEKIDSKIQPWVMYGPLWVSKWEGFKPAGSKQYIQSVINGLRSQLQEAQQCKEQLDLVEMKRFDEVTNKEILNLDEEVIPLTQEKVAEDIEEFKKLLKRYKARWRTVKRMADDQEYEGLDYTMKSMKVIECDDRLVGEHGLRLKIYDNGNDLSSQNVYLNMRDIQRGAKDQKLVRARFLEALTSWHKPLDPSGPARSSVVRRIFDKNGDEIDDVTSIENDQEVWLSYGEDYKSPVIPLMTLQFEKVGSVVDDESVKIYRETLDPTEFPVGSDKSSQWHVTEGFPDQYNQRSMTDLNSLEKHNLQMALKQKEFSTSDTYIQHKEKPLFVLHPSIVAEQKMTGAWLKDSQTWVVNKNGSIYSRAFPHLALSLDNDSPITVQYKDGSIAQGFKITLKKKSKGEKDWGFSPEGNIYPLSNPDQLVLTHLDPSLVETVKDGMQYLEGDEYSASDLTPAADVNSQQQITVAVVEKLKGHHKSKTQRWAIKQESLAPPYQWKHTKVSNPQWRKLAYSWPVLMDGNWNRDYKWPLEGTFIPNVASPMKQRRNSEDVDVKLKVYRNGEKDGNRFVHIVSPDMSSMEKERKKNKKQIEELELNLFLEKATSLLGLSFAARRLFNENGEEIFSLRALKRNQAVYVSVGEAWLDPKVTKVEHQRRYLLAKLTHDVAMISAFCDLRNPQDFVIDLEKGNTAGSRLVLRECSLSKEERKALNKGEINHGSEEVNHNNEEDRISRAGSEETFTLGSESRSAHEKSHLLNDRRYQAKQYAWQQNEDMQSEQDKSSKKSKISKRDDMKRGNPQQKFVFSDGFISPVSDPSLVFGVNGIDLDNVSGNVEVVLCRKSGDDPVQRWEMTEDGFIKLKCSDRLVLGVNMPSYKPGQYGERLSLEDSVVTLQSIRQASYGRANQKWLWDPVFNFIEAFHSSSTDKEITSASHVSICSYAVVGSEALSQDGYIIDIPAESPVVVCSSCAKVIRGRYQLTKAPDGWEFVCAMGNARKIGMKQGGSFSCLNGKVDLSTYEAETTLNHWMGQLEKLRQETSLRLLNNEIQSTTLIQACRVAAMRNGEGRLRQPELIVGTSISGILEQCSQRLSLGSAARRLYTSDGMHLLHMEQLIDWATNNFYKLQREHCGIPANKSVYERGEPEGNPITSDNHKQDEGNNSREGTPDHLAAEAGMKVTTSDLSKKLRPPSGKKRSSGDKSPHQQQLQQVPLSVILRNPVEVWVSCGENFIPPETAEKMFEANMKAQVNRNEDNLVLDTEKHVLRHMQGRRYKEMSPSRLHPTRSPANPILLEGGWMETTKDEARKLEKVHKLEEHLSESRPLQPHPKTKGIDLNRNLYRQANRKRVLVYLHGESTRRSAYVWGESIPEILADATVRLGMHRRAKMLYSEDGSRVTNFDLIERDSLLCVTNGDTLRGRPKQSNIEMKAKWARIRKERGAEATEIVIDHRCQAPDPAHVDPFGPSAAIMNPHTWELENN